MQRGRADGGFTLIELMVVVLIIAILLAIAIPTFLGVRSRAADRGTQSNLRNAITNELAFYADGRGFTDDPSLLSGMDSSLSYVNDLALLDTTPRRIYVELRGVPRPEDAVLVGGRSSSGSCYWIRYIGGTGQPRFAENDCSTTPTVFLENW